MLNKALLSSFGYRGYFLLLASQMAFSLAFCVLSRDRWGNPFGVPRYSAASFRASLPMGVLYVGNVVVGMIGLRMVNVPMFFCIRRLTPVTIMALDYMLYRRVSDGGTQLAVAVSVLGTLVAGWETLSSDGLGYAVTFANNLVTSALMFSQKAFADRQSALAAAEAEAARAVAAKAAAAAGSSTEEAGGLDAVPPPPDEGKLSTFGVLYYNALLAAPLALALSLVTGEVSSVAQFAYLGDMRFQFGFVASSAMGLLLTYTSVLATTVTSPMAISMTGA
jgi:hypothetical protein